MNSLKSSELRGLRELTTRELEEKLAVRLPVYVLLTKADLIAGFSEFFDDLDRERRAQVWGATFALADTVGPDGAEL